MSAVFIHLIKSLHHGVRTSFSISAPNELRYVQDVDSSYDLSLFTFRHYPYSTLRITHLRHWITSCFVGRMTDVQTGIKILPVYWILKRFDKDLLYPLCTVFGICFHSFANSNPNQSYRSEKVKIIKYHTFILPCPYCFPDDCPSNGFTLFLCIRTWKDPFRSPVTTVFVVYRDCSSLPFMLFVV